MTLGALSAQIDALFERPPDEGISLAAVVLKRGAIVVERYGVQPADAFNDAIEVGPHTTLISWSMAKSVTHAAVGVLVGDGRLALDEPAPVPEWDGTPKEAITLAHLLEMRSGLHFVEDYVDGSVSNCLEMLFGESGPSHAAYAAAQPLVAPPGEQWNYSSGTTNIICRIIGDVLSGGPGGAPADRRAATTEFLRRRLFDPAGMTSATPKFDAAGDFVGSSYLYATARDFARFGELYRTDGVTASGTRLLPAGWAADATRWIATDEETGFRYGRHWWGWPRLPGSLACHGYEGQFTLVVPDRETVVVHLGKTPVDVAPALVERLHAVVDAC